MKSIGIFTATVFVVGFALMFITETLRPKRTWEQKRSQRFVFHLSLMLLNNLILFSTLFVPFLIFQQMVYARGFGLAPWLGLRGPVEIIAALVTLDMIDYWWHRFNHTIPFLWRFHKVHHVDTHVDITTAFRFHIGELILALGAKALWILTVGPSLWAYAIFDAGITGASQFHHSNIDFSDKIENVIRKVFVTPRFHAAHHTVTPRTGNSNYSTIFIFWDKLFGTYREPDFEEMKTLGLKKGRESYLSFVPTLKGPFSREY
jgi:sterol desaturase/sphingolipid hydroxylase (fatty acid hydroxylase superfamily)